MPRRRATLLATMPVLVVLRLSSAAPAETVSAPFSYDEIQRIGNGNTTGAAPGHFDQDAAQLRTEIDQETVVSGEALRTRLTAAERRHEAEVKAQRRTAPSRGSSFLGGLMAFLPPPVQAIAGVFNGGGVGSLIGALPGVGGAIAGQVFALIPSKSARGTLSGTEVRSLREDSQRLAAAVAREERLGHLSHVIVLGASYRIDDVAGALSVIVDRDGGRWITLDHLRHTARVETLADKDPLRMLARLPASARGAPSSGGTVRTVHHIVDTGTSVVNGVAVHGYVDTQDAQQGPAACAPSAAPVTRTLLFADLPAPQRVEPEWANELAASTGCTYAETFDGPQPPADRLPIYALYAASDGFSVLQERGRVTQLDAVDARKLFEIPSSYTTE